MAQEKYVDAVFAVAKNYIEKNYPDKKNEFHNKIMNDDGALREAVAKTLDSMIVNATNAAKDESGTRSITYLAGPLGSKDMLKGFANNPGAKPELKELRELLGKSVDLDFADLKKKFSEHSGKKAEPYDDIRPLMSGLDVTLVKIAEDHGLNVAIDNNLKFLPGKEPVHEQVKKNIRDAQDNANLNIFAVALKPDEARQAALNSGMAVKEGEAEVTARAFHRSFNEFLKDEVKNITLVDSQGKVLFERRNGDIVQMDNVGLDKWKASFEVAEDRSKQTHVAGGNPADLNSIESPNFRGGSRSGGSNFRA